MLTDKTRWQSAPLFSQESKLDTASLQAGEEEEEEKEKEEEEEDSEDEISCTELDSLLQHHLMSMADYPDRLQATST